ncbi:low specificity L-threonine aldolase [Flavobacterium sp. TAB 87]|uniref:threonine aldolase family protein n=1 Tax=Flavobacterium sp. TAB 87 TaxID=1729581 RepID=UPI00076D0AD2|nr:GntG family PLP-dependent aldolase [Flavobacterium sp. TAB 87]KVV14857.1 L-allo-threonine aldolase [Flavobacterium sp. TAB 87]
MEINLVSDTITKPSIEMLQYMFNAQVGDDVYKQDPTVIELEAKVAKIFGMEAGLFFPSGTMANQVAIKLHTQPGEQLIADKYAHVYHYEGGGVSFNSGVSCCLIDGNRGMITAEQVQGAINDPEFYHSPLTSLVCIENTTNKGGGACYEIEDLKNIKRVCVANNLKYHLDGARIWNALIAKNQDPREFGKLFDTISVCLSKGLGAPIGSVLLGSKASIHKALRIRKILGGGMRQVGYLAAAGIFAIDNNWQRLAVDHKRAQEIAAVLQTKSWVATVEQVETNILIFSLQKYCNEKEVIEKLKQKNISISSMGQGRLRIVTHLDYRAVMHTYVLDTIQKLEI